MKAQEYLNNNYKDKTVTELNFSGWNESSWTAKPNWTKLTGELDLSGFPNLEKLDCSYNQITSLNLTNCPKLTELKCWDNELTKIKFPNSPLKLKTFYAWTNNLTEIDWNIFDSKSLTYISISNNNLKEQDISTLSKFTNLEELCVGNDIKERIDQGNINDFTGSLESLKNLTKLKKIQIERTDVKESFEHLPKNLRIICWNKGTIIKKLGLTKEETEKLHRANSKNFSEVLSEIVVNYAKKQSGLNLTSRQKKQIEKIGNAIIISELEKEISEFKRIIEEDKQNGMIASIIPLERLYVIRGNIKQFAKKWGIKKNSSNNVHWYKNLLTKKGENNLGELSRLRSLEEINESWWTRRESIYATQFIGRSAAVLGAALTFWNSSAVGGGILGVYPLTELAVSNMEKSREDRKNKWKEFLTDADTFLDNYNELLGILSQFEVDESKGGVVNKALNDLNKKIREFLNIYDGMWDGKKDGEIDINELIKERDELTKELNKEESKIQEIIDAIKDLEKSIIEYRKSSYYGIIEEKNKETITEEKEIINNNSEKESNLSNHEDEIKVHIEQAPQRRFTN